MAIPPMSNSAPVLPRPGMTPAESKLAKYCPECGSKLEHEGGCVTCRNCGYCKHKSGCAIDDRMTEVYRYFCECDNLVIASPVWFMTLTGDAINIASRFQTYWEAVHERGEKLKPKRGVIILTGGIDGSELPAVKAARAVFVTAGVSVPEAAVVKTMNTDKVAAKDDEKALADAKAAAEILNAR